MRVGVHEAVHENLVEERLEEVARQTGAVDVDLRERTDRRDIAASDIVHGQHARRRVVVNGLWNDYAFVVLQYLAERAQVLGLSQVVELAGDRSAELLDHRREPEPTSD